MLHLILLFQCILLIEKVMSTPTLTHVVMPFHSRQLKTVQENLQSWLIFPPCQSHLNVEFIFFVSGARNETLIEYLIKSFKSKCFESARVEFANLEGTDDEYLRGSGLMFEKMLSKNIDYGKVMPSHVFYMEPDCKPIRSYWLDAIQLRIISPNSHFWMKGSIFYGHADVISNKMLCNRIHINGNAIYNVGDNDFRTFYFKHVRDFIEKNYPKEKRAYDIDIFKLLFWENGILAPHLIHLFQFSDFIQNHFHSKYSLKEILKNNPNTFLIHGGNALEYQ